jgi:hypothetical protein
MCPEWEKSFETFYNDMGTRPSPEHSIDRKDNNKGYNPDNCHWTTKKEQANNRRNNILYDFDGDRKTLAEWCDEIGLEAIVITLAAVLGSVTAAWALWYVLYKRNKEGQV